ncbi:MAG: hypothetical protein Q8Q28_12565 [Pseudomonadota bacterium]|nr:hypothetical protein [Pseudomonadota bacterium]
MPFFLPPAFRLPLASLPHGVLVGLVLALSGGWISLLLSPRPVAALAVAGAADATVPNDAGARLFGAPAPGVTGAALVNGVRLTGIYAGPEAGGFASFQTPAGARGVFPGQEIQSGVVLSSLHPDHVVVLVGGLETPLPLRSPSQP